MDKHFGRLYLDEKNCTIDDLKTSYRKLAKKFHPDKNNEEDFSKEFRLLKESYDYLTRYLTVRKKEPESEIYTNRFYTEYIDFVEVEDICFRIINVNFEKRVGYHYSYVGSDGIFCIVKLEVLNQGKTGKILSNKDFKLYDKDVNCYPTLLEQLRFLNVGGMNLFLDKMCLPKIKTYGYLMFEVPEIDVFFLELNGGRSEGSSLGYERKIVKIIKE